MDDKKIEIKIGDISAFGIPHHNHNRHTVTVSWLSYKEAISIKKMLDDYIGVQETTDITQLQPDSELIERITMDCMKAIISQYPVRETFVKQICDMSVTLAKGMIDEINKQFYNKNYDSKRS